MGPLVVGAEGVVLLPNPESYSASYPIDEGLELVNQLKHFPTSRVVIMAGIDEEEPVQHFCKINNLDRMDVSTIAAEDKQEEPWLAQWYQIERLRASGPINLVLTAWPEVFMKCQGSHQPVLLFARRGSIEQMEDRSTWEELHAGVIRHRNAKAGILG